MYSGVIINIVITNSAMEAHAEDECPGVANLAKYVTRKYSKVETFTHQTMSQY